MIKDNRKKFDYLIACCNYRNLSIEERQEHFIVKEYNSKFFCIIYKEAEI